MKPSRHAIIDIIYNKSIVIHINHPHMTKHRVQCYKAFNFALGYIYGLRTSGHVLIRLLYTVMRFTVTHKTYTIFDKIKRRFT